VKIYSAVVSLVCSGVNDDRSAFAQGDHNKNVKSEPAFADPPAQYVLTVKLLLANIVRGRLVVIRRPIVERRLFSAVCNRTRGSEPQMSFH